MENKENELPEGTPSPHFSSRYARRILEEINISQVGVYHSKSPERVSEQTTNKGMLKVNKSTQTSDKDEAGPSSRVDSIFPDIQPEAFTGDRHTLRALAGRIYLIYCHLCCLDKKYKLTISDDSESEIEEVVVEPENKFIFGSAPDVEIERRVKNIARFNFGSKEA